MIIDSTGVGVGTTSPASKLHIKVGTNNNLEIQEASGDLRLLAINDARDANVEMEFAASKFDFLTGEVQIGDSAVANLQINNNSDVIEIKAKKDGTDDIDLAFLTQASGGTLAEKMRIISGGDVAIGSTTADPLSLAFTGTGLTLNENSGTAFMQIDGGNGSRIDFGISGSRNTTIYADANGAEFSRTTNHPITFKTNNSERMRIDGGGNFFFRKTSHSFATVGVEFLNSNITNMTNSGNSVLNLHRTSSDGTILEFFKDSGSVGSISTNANSLPSDRNFKRDISDLDLGLDLITKLKPSQYNYKLDDENSPKMYGLIAQDLEESLTEVGVEKNSTWLLQHNPKDDEKQSDYALDYLKLTPILIKAIQEQQEQIEALQSEINTLKGGE